MKHSISACAAALLLTGALAVSCHKESLGVKPLPEDRGEIALGRLKVEFRDELDVVTRAATAVDLDAFGVKIFDGEAAEVFASTYGTLPEALPLPPGGYRVEVESHKVQPAEWERPHYSAEKQLTVAKDDSTDPGTVTCSIDNIKVTVVYSELMKAYMGEDCKATVTVDRGSLDYGAEESRAGFFAAPAPSNGMTVEYSGTMSGAEERITRVFGDVRGGQHYILEFTYEPPPAEGDARFGVNVDLTCRVVDLNYNIDITEDIIPDDGEKVDSARLPAVRWLEGDIDTPARIVDTGRDDPEGNRIYEPEVTIEISAGYRIRSMVVEIDSEILTEEALTSVGLEKSFDLADPGSIEETLRNLGFPTGGEVVNKTLLPIPITGFIPALALVASGGDVRNAEHRFRLTVVDQRGNTCSRTLTLITD